ncbi:MAG: hypothetical protein ABIR03_14590 [Ginsengibacter sp.]
MKRLAVVFGIMCIATFMMLTEKDKKKIKKKIKKPFPGDYIPF